MGKFVSTVRPDWRAFLDAMTGKSAPGRVHYCELFLDTEIEEAVADKFDLARDLDPAERHYPLARRVEVLRFLGYDYVYEYHLEGLSFPKLKDLEAADTSETATNKGTRQWLSETRGPVATWEEFEKYPWPVPGRFDTSPLEWLEKNCPDDMCVTTRAHSFFEEVSWLMGLETFSMALYDNPSLVQAISDRVGEIFVAAAGVLVQFDRVKFLFGGDDMGHKTGTLVSPEAIRKYILPWHKRVIDISHAAGRPYFLHCCGNIEKIMPDLVEMGLDGKHSYEDVIEPVEDFFGRWGKRTAVLGGLDVDFLCRSGEAQVRERVRRVLDKCQGGRYALGTGNSVANYIPLDNYLAMLDEGRRYAG